MGRFIILPMMRSSLMMKRMAVAVPDRGMVLALTGNLQTVRSTESRRNESPPKFPPQVVQTLKKKGSWQN